MTATSPDETVIRSGAMAPLTVLEARALTKQYPSANGTVTALSHVNLTVGAGDVLCLLGANGAGKTTAINCFLGFITPTSGSAWVNGVDVALEPIETKRRLAYIPETVMLYKNLSGVENLAYFAELALGRRIANEELRAYLRAANLPAEADDRYVGGYSKGMRQKMGIALALAKKATALLLDEPTSGLDQKASNEFSHLLNEMASRGAGVLMATHDLFRAKESGTHVAIMKQVRYWRNIVPPTCRMPIWSSCILNTCATNSRARDRYSSGTAPVRARWTLQALGSYCVAAAPRFASGGMGTVPKQRERDFQRARDGAQQLGTARRRQSA